MVVISSTLAHRNGASGTTKGSGMRVSKSTSAAAPQSGFTLLEIMIVVVIIGLLAAVVAPSLFSDVDKARVSRAKSDIQGIETALNLYRLDNFKYPTTDQGLDALVKNPGETVAPNWKQGGYLKKVPMDPWGRPYRYESPGQHGEVDIFTYGADGQEGGDGVDADIGNWDLN